MKNLAIYTVVSLLIMVVVILIASGEILPALAGCVLMYLMRIVFKTPKGKKWLKTWYKVGYSFQLYLESRLGK